MRFSNAMLAWWSFLVKGEMVGDGAAPAVVAFGMAGGVAGLLSIVGWLGVRELTGRLAN